MNLANVFLTPLLLNTSLVIALEGSLTLQLSFGIHLEDFSGWVAFPRVQSSCWMASNIVVRQVPSSLPGLKTTGSRKQ